MIRSILIIILFMINAINILAQSINTDSILVRISEIEVYHQYLGSYLKYADTVGRTSVKEESGVICIYPMQTKRNPCVIRILEIYASQESYKQHIKTTHFIKYKTETLYMIKSLDLVDMNVLDPATMPSIFMKIPQQYSKTNTKTKTTDMDRIKQCKQNFTTLFGGEALNGKGPDPELMDILQKYIFGEIFQTGKLEIKTRELITCVILATMQQLPQLQAHAKAALKVGVTPIELRESIYQGAANIGFPKTLNALGAINTTFEQVGIKLPLENQSTTTEKDRYNSGYAIQQSLYKDSIKDELTGLPENMNEEVTRYITEVNFGDFQSRSGLDLKTRELLTFCTIVTLGFTEQLKTHIIRSLKAGNSIETITAATMQCMPYIGFPTALKALKEISKYATKKQ